MTLLVSRVAAALAAVGTLTAGARAWAGSFEADGTFVFDPKAVVAIDFDKDEMGVTTVDDASALVGKKVASLSPMGQAAIPVTLPKVRATYAMSFWVKSADAVGDLELTYAKSTMHVDEVAALYPTGRMTSDGWVELANDHIAVDGTALVSAAATFFLPNGGEIDAIEIVPDGDASDLLPTPNAACDGATDVNPCGTGQVCWWNVCRNVASQVPPIPADRDDVTAYLTSRMQLLFGPYLERTQDLPGSMVFIEQMKNAEDRYTYWNGFLSAVRRLHDGHTTTSGLADFVIDNPRPLNLCFLEGDGDLSDAIVAKDPTYLDVLVSHVGADHNMGLKPGDRLVAVDGQHPIAWARSVLSIWWSWPTTSNHTTFAELASDLRAMISRFANSIDVIRCDPVALTCGAVETISIADLALDDPMIDAVTCDNRPLRHLANSPADHATGETVYSGLVTSVDPSAKIYGLEWESLDTTTGLDGVGPDLNAAVSTWQTDAKGVIMDHRTGFGGTIAGPEILWNFSVPKHDNDIYMDRSFAQEEQPSTAVGMAIYTAAEADGSIQVCGTGSPNLAVPVAVLTTQDVSASDWLPQGFKGAPNTKVFGPFQTNGGFSTRYSFGYWLSLSYVMAVGDDFLVDGTTHNGRGVDPDVLVMPKQSDLLTGHDTVFETALAWVQTGVLP